MGRGANNFATYPGQDVLDMDVQQPLASYFAVMKVEHGGVWDSMRLAMLHNG